MAQGFEFRADLQVIVNLTIESDCGIAVIREDGLVAAAEVDDLQADGAEDGFAALEDALLVRSTMVERFCDPMGDAPVPSPLKKCKSRDAAHSLLDPRSAVLTSENGRTCRI